eukprot:6125219-Pyramimonas_sp.AAC.1
MEGDQQRPQQLYTDKQKAALKRALPELDAKHMCKHELVFWRKPDEVRTTSAIKRGQLTLAPVAPLTNISSESTGSSIYRLAITRATATPRFKSLCCLWGSRRTTAPPSSMKPHL